MNSSKSFHTMIAGCYFSLFAVLFLIPLCLLFATSFRRYELGQPQSGFTFANYANAITASPFPGALLRTLVLALCVAVLCSALAVAAVLGGWLLRSTRIREILLLGSAVMFFAGIIPRTFAFEFVLSSNGPFGSLWQGLPGNNNNAALHSTPGIVLAYLPLLLPLCVAILYASRREVPGTLCDAAFDLGASWKDVQWNVVIPAMKPGVIVCFLLSFIVVAGDTVVVDLIGGSQVYTVSGQILDSVKIDDWGTAASLGVLFLCSLGFTITAATLLLVRLFP